MERGSGTKGRAGQNRPSRPVCRVIAGLAGVLLAWIPLAAGAVTITFDDTPGLAPVAAEDVVPGTGFGPALDYSSVTIDGGIIALAITPSDAAATTLPNLYATADFLPLADGTLLPGEITGSFASPVSSLSVDVGNGNVFPATITLTAYSGLSVVDSESISLDIFGTPGSFFGSLSVAGPGITDFTVTSDQPAGSKAFSIDTLTFPVPEPGSALLILAASALVSVRRCRKV